MADVEIKEGSPITISDYPNSATDLKVALEAFIEGNRRILNVCFPVCVTKYDRIKHIVQVMPLVKQAFYNGKWEYIRRTVLFDVQIRAIQCGGFTVDVPVFVGDTGWVISSDCDTILLKKEDALTAQVLEGPRQPLIIEEDYQLQPNTPAKHALIHGFFVPDNWGTWDIGRYKDNAYIPLGNSVYIGSSIDTSDHRKDTLEKKYQKGDSYEKKTTSSIILSDTGAVSIASSTPTSTGQSTHIMVSGATIEVEAADEKKEFISRISIDANEGIVIQQEYAQGEQNDLLFVATPEKLAFRYGRDGQDGIGFDYEENAANIDLPNIELNCGWTDIHIKGDANIEGIDNLNIKTVQTNLKTGDINATADNIFAICEQDAGVAADDIYMAAESSMNINAGYMVNIGSGGDTNINAGVYLNLASGTRINITAPRSVDIVSADHLLLLAKKPAANITIETLSKYGTIELVVKDHGLVTIGTNFNDGYVNENGPTIDIGGRVATIRTHDYLGLQSFHRASIDAGTISIDAIGDGSHGEQGLYLRGNPAYLSGTEVCISGDVYLAGRVFLYGQQLKFEGNHVVV